VLPLQVKNAYNVCCLKLHFVLTPGCCTHPLPPSAFVFHQDPLWRVPSLLPHGIIEPAPTTPTLLTFWLGGQIKFSITYIHTQINTMSYVEIAITTPKKRHLQSSSIPCPLASSPNTNTTVTSTLPGRSTNSIYQHRCHLIKISNQASRGSIQLPSLLSSLAPHRHRPQTNRHNSNQDCCQLVANNFC
jgi:hypothetical protein